MLFPGGSSEAKFCGPSEDLLVLKSRRGFVELAIENGTPLVPCYSFGETDVLGIPQDVDVEGDLHPNMRRLTHSLASS